MAYETSISMDNLIVILDMLVNNKNTCRIRIICKGNSMAPFITNNDTVTIRPVKASSNLSIGTIAVATYPKGKKIVIHRIIGSSWDSYLTKGDNIFEPDGWVRKDQIIGVVETVIKNRISFNCHDLVNYVFALLSMTGILPFFNRTISIGLRIMRQIIGKFQIY